VDYLPIFIDVREQPCLLIGGGDVAARKFSQLARAGAHVRVVAPRLSDEMRGHHQSGSLDWVARAFEPTDVDDVTLVIAASDDVVCNAKASELCRARRIPVNVVDASELCSFIMPSIVDRAPLTIAISSGGRAPVLARLLRERLESTLPAALGALATLAGEFRGAVRKKFKTLSDRRTFWERTIDGRAAELIYAGRPEAARDAVRRSLSDSDTPAQTGEVYLVGAGPGDPDLLTFRALRLMQRADVVLYDRLVSDAVMDLVRRDARRVYVGKARGDHTLRQSEINDALVNYAQAGLKVLRLKGGDPFIFGRGGEEIDSLAEHGVPFQVVPGITAASGCAAFAGIPLTHRDHAQSCQFITGHLSDGSVQLDWERLAHPGQTLVFYMGLQGLPVICRELAAHGLDANTPAALVQQGTTAHQQVFTGTLETLPIVVEEAQPKPPTLLIVGTVVSLRERLAWYGENHEHAQRSAAQEAARVGYASQA
jgi:uroporphyrin-III C-methyltransferase / precorrin-2 dehydrogenase / sirohydrochlorin ferrochelatase